MSSKSSERGLDKKFFLKIVAVVFSVLVVVSLTLMALGKIELRAFWMIIIFAAFVAWYVMPKMNGTQD